MADNSESVSANPGQTPAKEDEALHPMESAWRDEQNRFEAALCENGIDPIFENLPADDPRFKIHNDLFADHQNRLREIREQWPTPPIPHPDWRGGSPEIDGSPVPITTVSELLRYLIAIHDWYRNQQLIFDHDLSSPNSPLREHSEGKVDEALRNAYDIYYSFDGTGEEQWPINRTEPSKIDSAPSRLGRLISWMRSRAEHFSPNSPGEPTPQQESRFTVSPRTEKAAAARPEVWVGLGVGDLEMCEMARKIRRQSRDNEEKLRPKEVVLLKNITGDNRVHDRDALASKLGISRQGLSTHKNRLKNKLASLGLTFAGDSFNITSRNTK